MLCPLCGLQLKQNLLSTSLAILVCSHELCIYPFNMTMDEIQEKRLMMRTSEREILTKMSAKMAEAGIDDRVASFMVKEDDTMEC